MSEDCLVDGREAAVRRMLRPGYLTLLWSLLLG